MDDERQNRSTRIWFNPPLEGKCKLFNCEPKQLLVCEIENLSRGGAQILIRLPNCCIIGKLASGDATLGLQIRLKDINIRALGRVRWAKARCMGDGQPQCHALGVEFTNIKGSAQQHLNRFLIRHQIDTRKFNRVREMTQFETGSELKN